MDRLGVARFSLVGLPNTKMRQSISEALDREIVVIVIS
jgi:hypothetical protein